MFMWILGYCSQEIAWPKLWRGFNGISLSWYIIILILHASATIFYLSQRLVGCLLCEQYWTRLEIVKQAITRLYTSSLYFKLNYVNMNVLVTLFSKSCFTLHVNICTCILYNLQKSHTNFWFLALLRALLWLYSSPKTKYIWFWIKICFTPRIIKCLKLSFSNISEWIYWFNWGL